MKKLLQHIKRFFYRGLKRKPKNESEFRKFIENASIKELIGFGFGKCEIMTGPDAWNKYSVVWLFPYDWYNLIPNGFIVTDINGAKHPFEHGLSNDDARFGCLFYGVFRD
jgi:hypothetical protein